MKEIWAKHLGSFWSPFFVWDGPSLNSRLLDFWSAQQYNAILFFRVKIQKGLGNLEKITSWNAKRPIFLGNFTPKTSNYCLKNRALGVPGPFNCWVIWCLGIHTLPGCKFSEDSSHKNTRPSDMACGIDIQAKLPEEIINCWSWKNRVNQPPPRGAWRIIPVSK